MRFGWFYGMGGFGDGFFDWVCRVVIVYEENFRGVSGSRFTRRFVVFSFW